LRFSKDIVSLFLDNGRARPQIWAIGISRLRDLYQNIVQDYETQADIRLLTLGYDAAVEAIRSAAPGRVDVVVAAGSNGAYLRSRVDVPVVLVNVTGFDVMDALTRARRVASSIAMVTYGEPPVELERFTAAFGIPLEHRVYRNAQDAQDCVLDLKQRGIGAIAGPGLVTDLAEREGLRGVFLYSHASVRAAFDTALEVARGGRVEALKRARLDIIFGHLRDGIVAVGPTGLVESLNPRMAEICGVDAAQAIGKRLHDLIPELPVNLLSDAHEEGELVQSIGRKSYVFQRIVLRDQGVQIGWLLTAQESQTLQRIDRSLRSKQRSPHLIARYRLDDLLGSAEPMRRLREVAVRYARSDATVLISGESGTGKELVAQGMHNQSARQGFPFVAVNCGAFPESLLESELFGYEEGAFTGARRGGKPGLIESAHGGTLFLDEIGEMPPLLQTRLLRVLQEREVVRLGANQPTPIDIRVMAATHRDLEQLIEQGSLRVDLYYRLNILRIAVPPLRERLSDLPGLLAGLLRRVILRMGVKLPVDAIADDLLPHCSRYHWPGNVRELENIVERVAIFYTAAGELERVSPQQALREIAPELFSEASAATMTKSLKASGRGRERAMIRAMLVECGGDQLEVCRRLGISRSTLWRRLREER
jgi:transcriptional regulator, propionate catabolism operon regulatory protein